jgi:hypothetical protein
MRVSLRDVLKGRAPIPRFPLRLEGIHGVQARGLISKAVVLVVLILIAYAGTSFLDHVLMVDLWFLFSAGMLASLVYYVSFLIPAILAGTLVPSLAKAAQVTAFAVLISGIILGLGPGGAYAVPAIALFLLGLALAVGFVAAEYSEFVWIIIRAAIIVAIGLASQSFLGMLPFQNGPALGASVLAAFVVVAFLSLIGLTFLHSDPMPRNLGRLFHNDMNLLLLALFVLLAFVYVGMLRAKLISIAPDQTVLLEWVLIVAVGAVTALRLHARVRSISRPALAGDWKRLVQQLALERAELEVASRSVEDFVVRSRKEGLVVLVTEAMLRNKVAAPDVESTVRGIVNYQAPPIPVAFQWAMGNMVRSREEARLRIVTDTLDQAVAVIRTGSLKAVREREAFVRDAADTGS